MVCGHLTKRIVPQVKRIAYKQANKFDVVFCIRHNSGMQVIFPWPPKTLSPNARVHWAVKSKATKALRLTCAVLAKQARMSVDWEGDIHVWMDYYPPDRRARDQDNMISASKGMLDGLADALGVNDKRFRLHPYVKDETGGIVKVRLTPGPTGVNPVHP